jgi:hypothetical protein
MLLVRQGISQPALEARSAWRKPVGVNLGGGAIEVAVVKRSALQG